MYAVYSLQNMYFCFVKSLTYTTFSCPPQAILLDCLNAYTTLTVLVWLCSYLLTLFCCPCRTTFSCLVQLILITDYTVPMFIPYWWLCLLYYIQCFLDMQMYSFDVNRVKNSDGDLLIHVAVKGGVCVCVCDVWVGVCDVCDTYSCCTDRPSLELCVLTLICVYI